MKPEDLLFGPMGGKDQITQMPSGLLVSRHAAKEYCQAKRRPTGIDLFAGAGGFSLGMIKGGFDVVAAIDNDPHCFMTYMANLGAWPCKCHCVEPGDQERLEKVLQKEMKGRSKGQQIQEYMISGENRHNVVPNFQGVEHYWFGDIRKITGREILDALGMKVGEIDCVFGSPPCQGFTTMGKRNVMDPRNSLVFEFCRMVLEIQPKTMILENVPGMVSMVTPEGLPVIDAMALMLADGGFSTKQALERTLKAQLGSVGLLRGKAEKKKKRSQKIKNSQTELL